MYTWLNSRRVFDRTLDTNKGAICARVRTCFLAQCSRSGWKERDSVCVLQVRGVV